VFSARPPLVLLLLTDCGCPRFFPPVVRPWPARTAGCLDTLSVPSHLPATWVFGIRFLAGRAVAT